MAATQTHTHTSLYQHDDELNSAVDHYNLIKIHSLKNMLITSTVLRVAFLFSFISIHQSVFVKYQLLYIHFISILLYICEYLYVFIDVKMNWERNPI